MRAFVENMQTKATWKSRLHKWGYKPLFCSVESKSGLDSLAFILRDQTSVIVGPSGVGKSSLINALRNSDHHAFDAAEVDNRLDQVDFYLFLLPFTLPCTICLWRLVAHSNSYFHVLISDCRQQVVGGSACWTGFSKKW